MLSHSLAPEKAACGIFCLSLAAPQEDNFTLMPVTQAEALLPALPLQALAIPPPEPPPKSDPDV
jgi:hypothetical protein